MIFLALTGLLTGCAVLDVASLETAIPLKPGKVELSMVQSNGLDLETVVLDDDELTPDGPPPGYSPATNSVSGVQGAIGLNNDMEIGSRLWISPNNIGAKVFLKKLMSRDGQHYLAFQPAFTYVNTLEDSSVDDSKYTSVGGELQLIYTQKASQYFNFSLIGRGNFNRYQETHYDLNGFEYINGPYSLIHGGVRGNFELRLHPFFFIPELGLDVVPVVNGDVSIIPVVGLALGVEL